MQTGTHLPSSPDTCVGERTRHSRRCETKPLCDTSQPLLLLALRPARLRTARGWDTEGPHRWQTHRAPASPSTPVANPKVRYRHPEPTLSSLLLSWRNHHSLNPSLSAVSVHRTIFRTGDPGSTNSCLPGSSSQLAGNYALLFLVFLFFFLNQLPFWEREEKPDLLEIPSCCCMYKIHQF